MVSADSMQVYRGMDIGTAKATPAMRAVVPHHMIDICEPEHDMSVAEFQQVGRRVLEELDKNDRRAIICGGSGLHFRSLVDPLEFPPRDKELRAELESISAVEAQRRLLDLDPAVGRFVDLANPRRVIRALEVAVVTGVVPSERAASPAAEAVRNYSPDIDFIPIGLDPGPLLADRVERRFDRMLESGLMDEVSRLRTRLGRLAAQAVGYRQLLPVVDGSCDLATGRQQAIQATRSLAKRQRTFFRRDPRINWVPWHPEPGFRTGAAIDYLNGQSSWTL